jgi:3-oxoacyl-[acyl-carrier protein] reductase
MTQQRDVFRLDGRSALVTGAGSGVGQAIARAFSAAGAAVLVTDIDKDAAVATAESITAAGGTAQPFVLDVRDSVAASEAAAAAAELGGGTLHVLVNNAGAIAPAMFKDLSEENFRRIVDIHLVGSFVCSQAALRHLPSDGTGRIINVTSAAGLTGTIGQANYGAAKAGIIGLTGAPIHHRQRRRAAGSHRDDRKHPQQRKAGRQDTGPNPLGALGVP